MTRMASPSRFTGLGWYCESEADVPPALQLEGAPQ